MEQLGINPEMDAEAKKHGLEHWSCVNPLFGGVWVRIDGCLYDYQTGRFSSAIDGIEDRIFSIHYIIPALKKCDAYCPIKQKFFDLKNAVFTPLEAIEYLEITDLSLENLRRVKKLLSFPKDNHSWIA